MAVPGLKFLQKALNEKQRSWAMLSALTIVLALVLLLLSDRSLLKIPLVFIMLVMLTIRTFKIIFLYGHFLPVNTKRGSAGTRLLQDVISRKYTGLFFRVSLALTIAFVTWAFNWQSRDMPPQKMTDPASDPIVMENDPPQTIHPPAPPPVVVKIEKAPDDKKLTDQPDLADSEADEKTAVKLPDITPEETGDKDIFIIVEEMPEFPGGEEKMYAFLNAHLRYPDAARLHKAEGMVMLEFLVDKTGQISDVKILRDIGYGFGEESVRVVNMMPPWKPGRQRGNPVRVLFRLPLNFSIKR